MFNKKHVAVDVEGHRVEITECQHSDYTVKHDGSVKYNVPSKFFGPDGKQLIPEGKGFYRTPWGIRYQLVD
jgi:hypothetical protein